MVNFGEIIESHPKNTPKMSQIRTLEKKLALSSIYQIPSGEYEVWMNLDLPRQRGVFLEPKDEDFGVWAWSAYTLERAERIAQEIETGVRKITPMVESPTE